MPIVSRLSKRRVANILATLRSDPQTPYSELARRYGVTRQAVRQLVLRRMPELDPAWKKNTTLRSVRPIKTCAAVDKYRACTEQFREIHGYEGERAKYCVRHRSRGKC